VLVLSCRAEFPSNLISPRSNFRSPLVKFCASRQLPVRSSVMGSLAHSSVRRLLLNFVLLIPFSWRFQFLA
jgi:hypothetical protein